ncbi:MAG: ATP-binding cassette domain-containing protein [Clostridiales bacterium]|nr:ATP-binding cassette domain-containing protein [Candidatus Cacconaster stercorequi]
MIITIPDIVAGKKHLIDKCQINIQKYALTSICGENGSGKTMLLSCLFSESVKNNISACMMDQSSELQLNRCTVLENIALSEEREHCEKAYKLLEEYGVDELASHKINELSGGEKRLICLLRCIYNEPDILFLDEPTNDLDYISVEKLIKILNKICKKCTVIAVTHDDRITSISSQIYRINYQRIINEKNVGVDKNAQTSSYLGQSKDPCAHKISLSLLRKALNSVNVLRLLFFLFSACMIYFSILHQQEIPNLGLDSIAPGEVDIFIPLSDYACGMLTEGAVPIRALTCFNDNAKITEKARIYKELVSQLTQMPINYGLKMKEDLRWIQFKNEYYDVENRTFIYPLELYAEEFQLDSPPDTSKYFDVFSEIVSEGAEPLDITLYNSLLNNRKQELENNHTECTWLTISLQGTDFYTFISSDSVSAIMDGNYCIRSAETIEFTKQVNTFIVLERVLKRAIVAALIYLALAFFATLLLCVANRSAIKVFCNCGAQKKDVARIVSKNIADGQFCLICGIGAIAVMVIWLIISKDTNTISAYIETITYIMVGALSANIRKRTAMVSTNNIYDWRKRR